MLATGDGAMAGTADLFRPEPLALTLVAAGWLAMAAAGLRLVRLSRRGRPGRRGACCWVAGQLVSTPSALLESSTALVDGELLSPGMLAGMRDVGPAPTSSVSGGSPTGWACRGPPPARRGRRRRRDLRLSRPEPS